MQENKSYLLVFTASRNVVPSQSYDLSKLGSKWLETLLACSRDQLEKICRLEF